MTAQEVRILFLTYFQKYGHVIVPSSSLVPAGDPSVLLTTAGMQQFKQYFKEPALASAKLGSRRVASVQKSFRTTDISEVGDASHLTFFEMLGNFSFGDYFKEEAILWAWTFLKDTLKISPDRMHVTIFKGEGEVARDNASADIWQKLGVPKDRIREADRANNFWGPTGDEGPCGPTTEIYVDGLEVWNIVFNEFYCHPGGKLERLPYPGVDTGMGLERLLRVLEQVASVYETDVFQPILRTLATFLTKASPGAISPEVTKSLRILADHLRASCFLITEGVRPSNVKQGYILRRLLRRMVRYERLVGIDHQYISPVVAVIVAAYARQYPELTASQSTIVKVIEDERQAFERALHRGLRAFERMVTAQPNSFSGQDAFRLYESFGFPYELVEELASERSLPVSRAEFEAALREHQVRSRGQHQ